MEFNIENSETKLNAFINKVGGLFKDLYLRKIEVLNSIKMKTYLL